MIVLEDLDLYNFRCYDKQHFKFKDKINIIVGNNAVGKTSIVEAIYALSNLKSHKASDDKEMIKKDEVFSIIKGSFNKNAQNDEIKYSISEKGKKVFKNEKEYKKLSDYLGYYTAIMFCPEDLDIIKGSPNERRKFVDSNLSSIDNEYLKNLIKYKKILKQRNEILKNIFETKSYDYDLLKVYTDSLVEVSIPIMEARKKFVSEINPFLLDKSKSVSANKEQVSLIYLANSNINELKQKFYERINLDIQAKTTTCGIHRDDYLITINEEDAKVYASQGQQRSAVLSLKLALAELIKKLGGDIIVILDDVFSELDQNRQFELLELIDNDAQIFITTTSIDYLSTELIKKSNYIEIKR